MPIDLEAQLASPTPLASTVWSLALLAVLGALYLFFTLLRGKRPPTKGMDTAWDKIIAPVRGRQEGALRVPLFAAQPTAVGELFTWVAFEGNSDSIR